MPQHAVHKKKRLYAPTRGTSDLSIPFSSPPPPHIFLTLLVPRTSYLHEAPLPALHLLLQAPPPALRLPRLLHASTLSSPRRRGVCRQQAPGPPGGAWKRGASRSPPPSASPRQHVSVAPPPQRRPAAGARTSWRCAEARGKYNKESGRCITINPATVGYEIEKR